MLALRPLAGITIDPLIALPVGGIICTLVTGKAKHIVEYTEFGLSKVIGVSILLIGTGTIAGIIKASALQYDVTNILAAMHMPAFILAPLAGILMAGATASTTAGATVAAQTFSSTLLEAGVAPLAAAAMIHRRYRRGLSAARFLLPCDRRIGQPEHIRTHEADSVLRH